MKLLALAPLILLLIPLMSVGAAPQSTITVTAQYTTGQPIRGMWIELELNGHDVQAGYTPITFVVHPGTEYEIYANSWTRENFSYWSQPGVTTPNINMGVAQGVHAQLIAFYTSVRPIEPVGGVGPH